MESFSIEKAIKRLGEISELLSDEATPLEKSLALLGEATQLCRKSKELFDSASLKIEESERIINVAFGAEETEE